MFCRINDKPIYLDEEKADAIERVVLNGKTRHDLAKSLYGEEVVWLDVWQDVMARIHTLTTEYLQREADAAWGKFVQTYHEFDYRGGQAPSNALGVVHSYCLATSQAAVHPVACSISCDVHNRMTVDSCFAHPIADHFVLCFNQEPQSWIARKLQGRFDASVHVCCRQISRIWGNMSSFKMLVGGALIEFGQGVCIDLSPADVEQYTQ